MSRRRFSVGRIGEDGSLITSRTGIIFAEKCRGEPTGINASRDRGGPSGACALFTDAASSREGIRSHADVRSIPAR